MYLREYVCIYVCNIYVYWALFSTLCGPTNNFLLHYQITWPIKRRVLEHNILNICNLSEIVENSTYIYCVETIASGCHVRIFLLSQDLKVRNKKVYIDQESKSRELPKRAAAMYPYSLLKNFWFRELAQHCLLIVLAAISPLLLLILNIRRDL